jgi:acyl-CoA thioesterase I
MTNASNTPSDASPVSPSLTKIQALMKDPSPINWVFAGDSITHGAFHTFGQRDYTEHFTERLRYEIGRRLDCVIKTGISGWKITEIQKHLQRVVLDFKPQVVSINIGINDSKLGGSAENVKTFESAYRDVLDRINAELGNPALVIHVPQPIYEDGTPRLATLPLLLPIVRTLAREYGAVLVDHDAVWRKNTFTYWLNDALHPNYHGHRKMAHTLLKALDLFDIQKSYVCQLEVPHA